MTYPRKFEFTGVERTKNYGDEGTVVFKQIRALFDIPVHGVKAGDVGGYLEDESCLSHFGNAWVADSAMIHDSSTVSSDAIVKDEAMLMLNCYLHGSVCVSGRARVYNTHLQGEDINIQGDATLEGCRIVGKQLLFKDYAHLQNVWCNQRVHQIEVSGKAQIVNDNLQDKTHLAGERIVVTDKVQLLNVPSIKGENIEVSDYCVLNSASIKGENILIEDMCTVKGPAIISSSVKLSDMVTVTATSATMFSNVSLSGDSIYHAEALAGA